MNRGPRASGLTRMVGATFLALILQTAKAQEPLAKLGPEGKLVYAPYTEQGDRLPDFSYCGYRGGGVAIPHVPARTNLLPAANGDDRERIQRAIDAVSALPLGADGFRGAVVLQRGIYRVGGQLNIRASGVVLRGEGDDANGTILVATAPGKYTVLDISGTGAPEEETATRREITANYVPVGARRFPVADASGFKVGDEILVGRVGNAAWIDTLGMNRLNQGPDDKVQNWQPFTLKYQRVVTSVSSNSLTVDAPIVNAIDRQYGGGYLVRYRFPGRIENVGVEGIRCDSIYASPTDQEHAWRFVVIDRAQHAWVRNCTAMHLAYACVELREQAKWITVQDTQCLDMISEIKGGLRYAFALSGQLCLVQRCFAREGRHDFVMHAWVPGPNVFLDCRSENAHADSGPHHRYATGTLYDNVDTKALNVANRFRSGTGHGWAGAQMVFWNCRADTMTVSRPPTAQNFAIGCTVPDGIRGLGYRESTNVPVTPRSLYLQQLSERLGPEALARIAATDEPPADPPFTPGSDTVVVLPDTEVYASRHPEILRAQMRWIRDHLASRNIKAVLHVGDLTNRNTDREWQNVRSGVDVLEGRVPFIPALGNHDYDGMTGRISRINSYFPVSELSQRSEFGAVFEPGKVDNHYQWVTIHGRRWMILSLEMGPRTAVIAWADAALRQHADTPTIVLTHAYLFRDNERYDHRRGAQRSSPHGAYGEGADGQELWDQLLRKHPNVMIVHCGHVASAYAGYRKDTGDAGNTVHQMLADYESLRGGGQGYLRLLEFLPDGRTVQVRTWSPVKHASNPVNADLETFTFQLQDGTSTDPATTRIRTRLATETNWIARTVSAPRHMNGADLLTPTGRYGGWTQDPQRATGFFHTMRDADGSWWLADPDGGRFLSIGVNAVRPNPTLKGRRSMASRFGTAEAWATHTAALLRGAGFNTLGAWSQASLFTGATNALAHTIELNWMARYGAKRGGTHQASGHVGYPDDCIFVFDPGFASFCREEAVALAATRDDPWLLGYFSDNELPFPSDALKRFLRQPAGEPGREAARRWLGQQRHGTDTTAAVTAAESAAFLGHVADTYFRVVADALRSADPNHLYLGCRFYGRDLRSEVLFRACAPHVDVVSINWYRRWSADDEDMDRWVQWSGKPFLITEWCAMAEDSGLANETGAGWIVPTQADRGRFYQHVAGGLLRQRGCVGWHWFRYLDNDPADTVLDPSNVSGNKGIVTSAFEPYVPLLEAMREVNQRAYALRQGTSTR